MGRTSSSKKNKIDVGGAVSRERALKVESLREQLVALEERFRRAVDYPGLKKTESELLVASASAARTYMDLWAAFMEWPVIEDASLDMAKSYMVEFAITYKNFIFIGYNLVADTHEFPPSIQRVLRTSVHFVLFDARKAFLTKLHKAVRAIQNQARGSAADCYIAIKGQDLYQYFMAQVNPSFLAIAAMMRVDQDTARLGLLEPKRFTPETLQSLQARKPDLFILFEIYRSLRVSIGTFQMYSFQAGSPDYSMKFGAINGYNTKEAKRRILTAGWGENFVRWCCVMLRAELSAPQDIKDAVTFLRACIYSEKDKKTWDAFSEKLVVKCDAALGTKQDKALKKADAARDKVVSECNREIIGLDREIRKAEQRARLARYEEPDSDDDDDETDSAVIFEEEPVYELSKAEQFYNALEASDKLSTQKLIELNAFLAPAPDLKENERILLDAFHAQLVLQQEPLALDAVSAELAHLERWEGAPSYHWVEREVGRLEAKQRELRPPAAAAAAAPESRETRLRKQTVRHIALPDSVKTVLGVLDGCRMGLSLNRAWVSGGFPRDRVWGLQPKDVDIVCFGLRPALFRSKAYQNGLLRDLTEAFRGRGEVSIRTTRLPQLLVISVGREEFEVWYSDKPSLQLDCGTRCFTLNTMGVGKDDVLSHHGSALADCEARKLVPCDSKTFFDDPVRVLRAVDHLVLKGCHTSSKFERGLASYFGKLGRGLALTPHFQSCLRVLIYKALRKDYELRRNGEKPVYLKAVIDWVTIPVMELMPYSDQQVSLENPLYLEACGRARHSMNPFGLMAGGAGGDAADHSSDDGDEYKKRELRA